MAVQEKDVNFQIEMHDGAKETNTVTTNDKAHYNTKFYFSVYCLTFVFDGFLLGFPGSIYVELQNKLHTSTFITARIYTATAIGYIICNLLYGYITDHCKEVHRIQSISLLITAICIVYIPFNSNVTIMFILFTIIGMGWAINETNYTLFIFRLYPISGTKMFLVTATIVLISAAMTSLMIQFSISLTNTFTYPFIIASIIGVAHSILILFLETPKHDTLRALKRTATDSNISIDIGELSKSVSMRLESMSNYKMQQNIMVTMLIICMGCHGAMEGALLPFITTYCVDFLHINDKYGRFFIACYYAATIVYRIFKYICFPNFSSSKDVFIGFIFKVITGIIFIFYGNNMLELFVLYSLIGLFNASCLPGLCSWAESIKPTTGFIASMFWIAYGTGYGIMTFTLGLLIQPYGVKVMCIAVMIPVSFGVCISGVTLLLHKYLKRKEKRLFAQMDSERTVGSSGEGTAL